MSKKNKRRARAQAQSGPVTHSQSVAPDTEQAKARREAIEKAAHELFMAEGGASLERMIRTGDLTAECFETQMHAARDGGEDWGPTITPYEDRMNRGLQLRLLKERNKWLEDCRERVAKDWPAEAQAPADIVDEAGADTAPADGVTPTFTESASEPSQPGIEPALAEAGTASSP